METSFKSKLDPNFDYTCLSRYLDKPDRVTFQPTAAAFMDSCKEFEVNWLMVWCLSYVLTNGFVSGPVITAQNYLGVPDGKYRVWREGISAGLRYIQANNKDWQVATLDKIYTAGVSTRMGEVYADVMKFWQTEGARPPPIKPREPDPLPTPIPEQPTPATPSAPSTWKVWIAGLLGVVTIPWFFAKLFLPGGVVAIVNAVLDLLHKLVGN